MPIVRKSHAGGQFRLLEERIERVKTLLEGTSPNPNLCDQYAHSATDYERDFIEIDRDALALALDEVAAVIRHLKKTKTLPAEKLHKSK